MLFLLVNINTLNIIYIYTNINILLVFKILRIFFKKIYRNKFHKNKYKKTNKKTKILRILLNI